MSRFRRNFGQDSTTEKVTGSVPKALLQQARKTGQLNLSNRELKEVPSNVWKLNAPPNEGDADFASSDAERWWDQVALTKLILASNGLVSLSEDISVFSALAILDLHDNKLPELPHALSTLEALEKLDVSHNQLTSIPLGICDLLHLTTLLLQHNQLTNLPQNLGKLSNLRVLDTSHNKLEALPNDLKGISDLQRLNLSNNQISVLPDDICKLSLLSYLDLSYNKLSKLPNEWGKMTSIKELYFRNNSLTVIPDLSLCATLKEVYLAQNALTSFEVSRLPSSLMIIELRDNKIKEVGEEIVEMKELHRLDLANNDISTLPPKMGLMEHIKALNVEGNPMRGIRRDIINKGTIAIIKYLRTRISDKDVNGSSAHGHRNGTSSLPMSSAVAQHTKMHALASTKSLDLGNKAWDTSLLDGCAEIPLEVLNISKMGLCQLPHEVCQFQSSLKTLNVSLNKISMLGPEMGGFLSLTHLNLGTNLLTNLPKELGALGNLIELNIMQNKLTFLPECIFSIESLEHLLAGGNQIASINIEGLRKLPRLSTLSLQNNNIAQVPPELGLISSLRNLQLDGNTFRIPRHNILQQGTQAVLDYLQGRVPNR